MSLRWPHTWWLLTMWDTDPELLRRESLARCGYGLRVTAEEWTR